jgi:hypothetical protein
LRPPEKQTQVVRDLMDLHFGGPFGHGSDLFPESLAAKSD